MKAAVIYRYGPAYSFKIEEMPAPALQESEVLVKVKASSVNPVDWKIRQGKLKLITGMNFPKILGADFSGEVVERGSAARQYKNGDQVYGMVKAAVGGAYAEYVKVKEKYLAPKPANMSHEEAAAMPLTGMTALQGLRDHGRLTPDEKVLINGASGGIGTYGVQIARTMGARVTGVCSTRNLELVQELGAHKVIDYTKEEVLKPAEKYHLIFDTIGNLSFQKAKKCLYDGGILVSTLPSAKSLLDLAASKLSSHHHMVVFMLRGGHNDLTDLKKWAEEGKLRSVIDSVYPLADIASAHLHSEEGHARGKIVVRI